MKISRRFYAPLPRYCHAIGPNSASIDLDVDEHCGGLAVLNDDDRLTRLVDAVDELRCTCERSAAVTGAFSVSAFAPSQLAPAVQLVDDLQRPLTE